MAELNVLQKWERGHWQNVFRELRDAGIELNPENIEAIIEHMSFRKRSKRNPDLCKPLYSLGKSCHPEINDLNCLLCACPSYDSSTEYGGCKSKDGRGNIRYHQKLPKGQVWECTKCSRYHSPEEVRHFLKDNIFRLRELCEKSLSETSNRDKT
jgi:Zn-finger protein